MTYTALPMVAADGSIQHPIILGDDYIYPGRGFVWSIDPITGWNIGDCTCWFGAAYKEDTWLIQGTLAVVGAKWELRFSLTRAYTDQLQPGYYGYSVEVRRNEFESTMVRSDCTVRLQNKYTQVESPISFLTIDGGHPDSLYDPSSNDYAFDGGSP